MQSAARRQGVAVIISSVFIKLYPTLIQINTLVNIHDGARAHAKN
jgi:hypothetical protein